MNIVALLLVLAGAGLSLFQPVIPFMNLSVMDLLSSSNIFAVNAPQELRTAAYVVLAIAAVAVICGIFAAMRQAKGNCVTGLAICGLILLASYLMFMEGQNPNHNPPLNIRGIAESVWMKTVLVWALCYLGAAVCAHFDQAPESSTSSTSSSSSSSTTSQPALTPLSVSTTSTPTTKQTKDFEPVLGVETPALIKRGKIFLSDDDFAEAERYFEQALRQDPENSQAYLGKLMAQLKVHNIDELSSMSSSLSEQKLFKRALEFANDEEKLTLQKCLDDNATHLEALKEILKQEEQKRKEIEALEKKYDDAAHAKRYGEDFHNIDSLKRAQKMFEELGDYKDSKSLAEAVGQQIVEEEERKEGFFKVIFITALVVIGAIVIMLNR